MQKPKQINIQDAFLNHVRKEGTIVTIFLTNGFQLRGKVKAFDNFTVVLDVNGAQQMVYKHAISTFVPATSVPLMQQFTAETPEQSE